MTRKRRFNPMSFKTPPPQQTAAGLARDEQLIKDCVYNLTNDEALDVINLAIWLRERVKEYNNNISISWPQYIPLALRWKQSGSPTRDNCPKSKFDSFLHENQ